MLTHTLLLSAEMYMTGNRTLMFRVTCWDIHNSNIVLFCNRFTREVAIRSRRWQNKIRNSDYPQFCIKCSHCCADSNVGLDIRKDEVDTATLYFAFLEKIQVSKTCNERTETMEGRVRTQKSHALFTQNLSIDFSMT